MTKRWILAGSTTLLLVMLGLLIAVAAPPRGPLPTPACGPDLTDLKNVANDSRCFELRTYTVREGSSIDLLHTRFRDRTNALFKKHGMSVIGYWQPVAKRDTLVYVLAYKDGKARDAAWAAFGADPEWVKTRTEMPVNVQVESVFMSATDYSPLKQTEPDVEASSELAERREGLINLGVTEA